MQSYRYTLEPYTGPASRYICPQCKDRRKTFVRYIDTQTSEHLADHVGRCGRQDKCTYHYTPKQFFENNHTPIPMRRRKPENPFKSKLADEKLEDNTTVQHISCIAEQHWKDSLPFPGDNNLVLYLAKMLGNEVALRLTNLYRIGTSRLWKGATVFWQFDEDNTCRAGKIMLYNPETGRRVKEPFNHICWVHALKDEQQQPLYPNYNLKQCLFGEHLLTGNTKPIALVESEKTAILGAHFDQTMLWLATGGKEGLTAHRCASIADKEIYLYPDGGAEAKWEALSKDIFESYEVVCLPGLKDGEDVGDVWCRTVV